jgi:predicted transcriptional regulator of viral defense system
MKKRLGQFEARLFAYVQLRGLHTVRAGELADSLGLSSIQERKLLSRLAQTGLIARVWRGLYLVPQRLPLGGNWSPGEALAINTLMADRRGRYQICGPSAFNRYGFDDQVPNRVYAYNNRISGDRTVGTVALTLIKVADERLGGSEAVETGEGQTEVYASRARTLMDAVYDWARFNSLPRAYGWIQNELAAKRITATELVKTTLRFGDTGTVRRMGLLLEREGVEDALLRKLERRLKPTKGLIPWIPNQPKRGKIIRRWGVVLNDNA